MKLITAIAALALLAGSMDVEAQKRGKANNPPGGEKTPGTHQKAPEGAETGHPHISPVARLAIGVFGELDPEERKDLAEAAREGDEEALEELRSEHVEAIEAMLGALEDEGSRKLIHLGVLLASGLNHTGTVDTAVQNAATKIGAPFVPGGAVLSFEELDGKLDMVEEQLEAQLNSFNDMVGGGAQSGSHFTPTD